EPGKQRGVIQISGGSKRPESAHLSFERCWALAPHYRGSVRAFSRFPSCNAQHSVTRFHSIAFFRAGSSAWFLARSSGEQLVDFGVARWKWDPAGRRSGIEQGLNRFGRAPIVP